MPRRAAVVRPFLLALMVAVVGCSDPEPASSPSPVDTVAEIRTARDVVQQPAVDLHVAAQRVVAVVEERRSDPAEDPAARLAAFADVASGPFDDLKEAIAAVDDLTLQGGSEAVRGARAALAAAAGGGRAVLQEARADLDLQRRAADVDLALEAMVSRWEEPGSRSQQLDRFADLAADADALVAELEDARAAAACLTTFARRRAAAAHVADATRELRAHVEAYRGTAFDARRDELAGDPYGLERPLREADVAELDCWRDAAPVVLAAAAIEEALAALEDALNPSAPSPGPSPSPSS